MGTPLIFLMAAFLAVPWLLIIVFPLTLLLATVATLIASIFISVRRFFAADSEAYVTRALLVDDQPTSLLVVEDILRNKNIDYTVIESGQEITQALANGHVDFVILDYDMPEVNGAQALALADQIIDLKIKRNEMASGRITPVMGYSSYDQMDWHLPVLKHFKFVGCLRKTTLPSKLKKEIERMFELPAMAG